MIIWGMFVLKTITGTKNNFPSFSATSVRCLWSKTRPLFFFFFKLFSPQYDYFNSGNKPHQKHALSGLFETAGLFYKLRKFSLAWLLQTAFLCDKKCLQYDRRYFPHLSKCFSSWIGKRLIHKSSRTDIYTLRGQNW